MELFTFARFHACEGQEEALAKALSDQVPKARAEPGCLAIAAYRSVRDPRLFWIEQLIDHPFDATRTHMIS